MGGAGDIGGLLAIEDLREGWKGTFHPSFDGNGNLMALHEASTGNMVAAYEYDPFGNPVRTSGVYAKENPIRFSGKYFDNETSLSYFGFRYYNASLGRFINRDPLEERGGWNLYKYLKQGASDPYAGASGVQGTSWSTEWEQAQDRLLSNTSLPHTTQSVTFNGKRNSGLPGASEENQKTYSANATGHYAQGGAPGTGPKPPSMTVGDPATGNVNTNLYIFTGNNPVNRYDAHGLFVFVFAIPIAIEGSELVYAAVTTVLVVAAVGSAAYAYDQYQNSQDWEPGTINPNLPLAVDPHLGIPNIDLPKTGIDPGGVVTPEAPLANGPDMHMPALPAPTGPDVLTTSLPANPAPDVINMGEPQVVTSGASAPQANPIPAATSTGDFKVDTRASGKEKADDIPSWVQGQKPQDGESGKDYAGRLLDAKYGKGKYNTGPGSEYNKLKKYGDRWRANNN